MHLLLVLINQSLRILNKPDSVSRGKMNLFGGALTQVIKLSFLELRKDIFPLVKDVARCANWN